MIMRRAVQSCGMLGCILIGGCNSSASSDCLRTLNGHSNSVCAVTFSPDGKQVVSGAADDDIRFWDVESGRCQRTIHGHSDWIHSVAMSSDGRFVATAGRDKLVKLWE